MTAVVGMNLRRGLAAHQDGRLADAQAIYSSILERDPDQADAWHLLGRIALARRDFVSASALVLRAIRCRPDVAPFHASLGEILAAQTRDPDACLCYREALRLDPTFVPALVNLGNSLQNLGRYRDACDAYRNAIRQQPDCAEAFGNLGNALRSEGRTREALDCYLEAWRIRPGTPEVPVNLSAAWLCLREFSRAEEWARRALEIDPRLVPALSNLSLALLNQGRLEEAELTVRAALDLSPQAAHLHSNLGSVLLHRGALAEAEASLSHALSLNPDYLEAANNLGVLLRKRDRLDEADRVFAGVLRRRPAYPEAWTNRGTVLQLWNRHQDAIACFDQALRVEPANPKAHFCRALSHLALGDFRQGFVDYEWRWEVLGNRLPESAPAWDGSDLNGATILLYAEQGLGDTLQFARFVPIVAAKGGRVVVECQPAAALLLGRTEGVAAVIAPDSTRPHHDTHAALMSLPGILGIDSATVPARVPYLCAAAREVERLRTALGPASVTRIGIAWSGNPQNSSDHLRSLSCDELRPLRAVPGVEWYSLHVGAPAREAAARAGNWMRHPLSDSGGLEELAALMECLDLVISVDTMAAHLAGALGRPVWTMLCWAPDWRWRTEGDTTPWYPSMRLFRQSQRGQWNPVVQLVAAEAAQSAQALRTHADKH